MGEWKHNSTHSFNLGAISGGEWSASRLGRFKPPPVHIGTEARWAQESDWTPWRRGEETLPCRNTNYGRPARILVVQ